MGERGDARNGQNAVMVCMVICYKINCEQRCKDLVPLRFQIAHWEIQNLRQPEGSSPVNLKTLQKVQLFITNIN